MDPNENLLSEEIGPQNQLEDYLAAALPAPVVLLHQPLKPFSLGHKMLLRRYQSPFLTGERHPDVSDLLWAIYVCVCDYDEAQAELIKPQEEFDAEIQRWMKLCGEFEPAVIIQDFFNYLIDGSRRPEFRRLRRAGERAGADMGAPTEAVLFATLTGKLHFTRTEALNCPYGWAQWLFLTYWEGEGRVLIENKFFVNDVAAAAKALGMELIAAPVSPLPREEGTAGDAQSEEAQNGS